MQSNYKRLGDYIRKVDTRNRDSKVKILLGISMTKEFRISTSNINGTDMSVYKVVNTDQFSCDFMSVIRVHKFPVVLKKDEEPILVSPAYTVFEVKDKEILNPEYLMMWFRRSEFDRYADFKCDSAIRGGFDWDALCDCLLPIPSLVKQSELVKEYNVIQNRIKLNKQLIAGLEETAQTIFKQWFIDFEFPDENNLPYKINGGEMMESELGEIPKKWNIEKLKSICSKIGSGSTPKGGKESYHASGTSLVRSMNVHDFIFSSDELAFIDDRQAKALDGVTLKKQDILLNITGVSVARCCIVPDFVLPARVNQHVLIIRPKSEYYLSNYLLCLLCYSDNKSKLLGISQSGSTREAITKAEMEEFTIVKPDKVISKRFDDQIYKIRKAIEIKTLKTNKLNELKNLLLAKMTRLKVEKI
jgi:type I restriction enzyme S subunit